MQPNVVSDESMKQLLPELTKTPKITVALPRWQGINFFFKPFLIFSLYKQAWKNENWL